MSHQVIHSHTPTSQIIHRHSVHQLILPVLCNIFMQNVNASATVTPNLFISSAPKRIHLHGKKLSFCLLMLRWICEKFARQPKRQSICFTPLHCRRSSFERWPLINKKHKYLVYSLSRLQQYQTSETLLDFCWRECNLVCLFFTVTRST